MNQEPQHSSRPARSGEPQADRANGGDVQRGSPAAASEEINGEEMTAGDFLPADEQPDRFDVALLAEMDVEQAVQRLIQHATRLAASDLFFHSQQDSVQLAVRTLGAVQPLGAVSAEQGRHLISHVKAMAEMDISEHRRPMDGRWLMDDGSGRQLEMRVNSIATLFGEDMTLRIWDRQKGLLELGQLGLFARDLAKLIAMLQSPSGLILVTGPTGTGKTTTLYSTLQYLNDGRRKLSTLEDPVEYVLSGVRQSQVNPKIGLDFPELLRGVLRQSPDVIMIGEIRDEQTAVTAVRAANSGHLVLATLHAPVAAEAVQSMMALGAPAYFLSTCLLGVLAQRLVRTLCPYCRMFYDVSEVPEVFEDIRSLLEPGEAQGIYGPRGCVRCYDMGYAGRNGLFEVMPMNQEIRQLLTDMRPAKEIERAAVEAGMIEFRRGTLWKVAQGVTSIEEIISEVPAEYLGLDA